MLPKKYLALIVGLFLLLGCSGGPANEVKEEFALVQVRKTEGGFF